METDSNEHGTEQLTDSLQQRFTYSESGDYFAYVGG